MNKFFSQVIKCSLLISCLSLSPQSFAMDGKEDSSPSGINPSGRQQNVISPTQSDSFLDKRIPCSLHVTSRLVNNKIKSGKKH